MTFLFSRRKAPAPSCARPLLALPLCVLPLLGCAHTAAAQPPRAEVIPHAPAAPVQPAQALDLAGVLSLGDQHHPRIAAQRASLAAAEDGLRALERLHAPGLIAPELPTRRRQAELGVRAAAAGLEQARQETAYGVTRTYFTVLYAREQEKVTRSVVDRITATRDAAQKQLDAGARDVTSVDVNRATVYLRLATAKRVQAAQGVKRALAALREAAGVGPEVCLEVGEGGLPEPGARPCREEIHAWAQSRRPELARAVLFADAACLEVEAQGSTTLAKRMETFAAGSDIHAVSIPPKQHNGEYRPGAVPPEYPTLLAGRREDRVKRAQSLHARALAVTGVTRNLLGLEADDAYLRWEEAALRARETREAAQTGEALARDLSKDFAAGAKVKVEEVVNAWVLASQARAEYNEALYRQILALADLERVTAGGFCARLTEAGAPAAAPVKGNGEK